MTPADALASHRALIGENGRPVAIRRYTGTGAARTKVDTATTAFVRDYGSDELIGTIAQGDQVAIALVDDLTAILPVTTSDKLVIEGQREKAIKNVRRREVGGVLVAIEIHAEG